MRIVTYSRAELGWRGAHSKHLTTSDVPSVIARRSSATYRDLVERLVLDFENVEDHRDVDPDPWEEQHEEHLNFALRAFEREVLSTRPGSRLTEVGFVEHDVVSWLGCSPHGLVGDDGMVHVRYRRSLRAFVERRPRLTTAERARLQTAMFVCDRQWCDVFDFWEGAGIVADMFHVKRLRFSREWLDAKVLARVAVFWQDVAAQIRKRKARPRVL